MVSYNYAGDFGPEPIDRDFIRGTLFTSNKSCSVRISFSRKRNEMTSSTLL